MNGMDDNEDEHNFSDDDLDALPDHALLELEQNALLSTQQPKATIRPEETCRPSARQNRDLHHPRLADIQNARPTTLPYAQLSGSQYGQLQENQRNVVFIDESKSAPSFEERDAFLPQNMPSEMTQREQWRQDRYSGLDRRRHQQREWPQSLPMHPSQQKSVHRDTGQQDRSYVPDPQVCVLLDGPHQTRNPTAAAEDGGLRARLDELIRERDELSKELDTTKSMMLTQKGEISIIRANQLKESNGFTRQLSAMKKSMQDESTKNKAVIQAVAEESQRIATENKFLKQDLAEEAAKSKNLYRTLKERPLQDTTAAPATTPQKTHAGSLRDGFDDDEIMAESPVKSGRRSKAGTPTAGGKRKRKADIGSPIPPLVLRQSYAQDTESKEPEAVPKAERVVPRIRKDATAEKNLKFMQRILNHRQSGQSDRIIEACMKHSFPSDPSRTFTTILLEATAQLSGKRLPADLLRVFADLWSRTLKEKYYKPIPLLTDAIAFICALETATIEDSTIKSLLPVLQVCGEINGVARFKHSPVQQKPGNFRQTPQSELKTEADGGKCLEMLYNLACACGGKDEKIELFWRSMSTDFVLMMLHSSQPIYEITLMLSLLSTSILPTTFGNICSTADEQFKMETYIVDRVCWLLWETPTVDEGVPPYTKSQICTLRLEAMNLLSTLAIASSPHPHEDPSNHGSILLANHPAAIARLVRSMYDEVDAMYLHDTSHELHAELVNQAVSLLFRLLQMHGDTINLQEKLTAVNGGVHKHRIVLTRLAFSEGVFLDRGITDETVLMATDMLEEAVTPEEAEALVEAFPNYKGRRGGTPG